jgi:hypothetical protein
VHGYSVLEVGSYPLDMAAFVELNRLALFGLIFV